MTREIRRAYYQKRKGNTSRSKPKTPYCGICSDLTKQRPIVNHLHAGDECYEVHYANGGIGYYHTDCMDNPKDPSQQMKIANIKSLDVDHWNGVEDFIKPLVDRKLADKQIIAEIERQFNCSHTTAWRRLREFNTQIP